MVGFHFQHGNMEHEELYDQICKVLTWYEHPEESPLPEEHVTQLMYENLVRVQNEMFNN